MFIHLKCNTFYKRRDTTIRKRTSFSNTYKHEHLKADIIKRVNVVIFIKNESDINSYCTIIDNQAIKIQNPNKPLTYVSRKYVERKVNDWEKTEHK